MSWIAVIVCIGLPVWGLVALAILLLVRNGAKYGTDTGLAPVLARPKRAPSGETPLQTSAEVRLLRWETALYADLERATAKKRHILGGYQPSAIPASKELFKIHFRKVWLDWSDAYGLDDPQVTSRLEFYRCAGPDGRPRNTFVLFVNEHPVMKFDYTRH